MSSQKHIVQITKPTVNISEPVPQKVLKKSEIESERLLEINTEAE